MPGGKRDSSRTRVQPIFHHLLSRCPDGADWLPTLLQLAKGESPLPMGILADPGRLAHSGAADCFERRFAPPERFLRWLIEHPEEMVWPKVRGRERVFGPRTQRLREDLFGRHGCLAQRQGQELALAELAHYGPRRSRRHWWTFEGFTHVDCCLETETLLLFIEGKRTDRVAPATAWYPQRNQLARNLEVAAAEAHGRAHALLLLAEHQPLAQELDLASGLPHLSEEERADLLTHFIGWVTWKDVCCATGIDYAALPATTDDLASPYYVDKGMGRLS